MSLAKVVLSGLVDSDPEKRFTSNQNMAVTTFNMWVPALPRQGQASAGEQDGFTLKVTCWRQLAEVIAETIRKGDAILVEGKLMTSSFQSPEGVAKKGYEIEINSLDKLAALPQSISAPAASGSSQASGQSAGGGYASSSQQPQQAPTPVGVGGGGQAAPQGGGGFASEDFMNTVDDIPF